VGRFFSQSTFCAFVVNLALSWVPKSLEVAAIGCSNLIIDVAQKVKK